MPLTRDAEQALFALATKPDLDDPRLKTIGLTGVLERLDRLLQGLPIDSAARKRMVSVRNGAMHVGTSAVSRQVLLDSLALCRTILEVIDHDPARFYGDHQRSFIALLDAKRTEIGHRVAAKRAKAARDLSELESRLGHRFDQWVDDKEMEAEDLSPRDFGPDLWGVEQDCPECNHRGRLFGQVEVQPQIAENPPIDERTPPDVYIAGWTIEMFPEAFECCVCQLVLHNREELAETDLPAGRLAVSTDDLGYDFDPASYSETRYAE